MLLRSSSTPILNSWLPTNSSSSSSTPDHHPPKSIHLITSKSAFLCSRDTSSTPPVTGLVRASSDPDLRRLTFGSVSESGELISSGSMLLTNSGLGLTESVVVVEEEEEYGGGSFGGGGSSFNYYNNSNDNDTDGYYMRMIKANPGNSLILGNYAKFLKEVRGDYVKAEEYCGRAILANPGDPSVLALYADLIWQSQRDSSRAESYFDQAVKASPDDCYVLGSYAHFLWDAEDEDEDEDEDEEEENEKTVSSNTAPSMAYYGVSVAS